MQQRILVCGGRDFGFLPNVPFEPPYTGYEEAKAKADAERKLFERVMNAAEAKYDIQFIIEGGARGADKLAFMWATKRGINLRSCPADWKTHGKKAGILRNQTMLDDYDPTLTIAFPGGTGTADMVRRSKAAGVKVIEVPAI